MLIIVFFVMMFVFFILFYVWLYIFNIFVVFGEFIKDLGVFGVVIYGFFNCLLIFVGLYYVLNFVFWFDVVGINDILNFLGGVKFLVEGIVMVGVIGMY